MDNGVGPLRLANILTETGACMMQGLRQLGYGDHRTKAMAN